MNLLPCLIGKRDSTPHSHDKVKGFSGGTAVQDGTIDENLVCVEEKYSVLEDDKTKRSLVSFGAFGSVAVSPGARNALRCLDYDTVKRLTSGCQKKGFARGKLFNCYWVDHVIDGLDVLRKEGKKTACDYVNELNAAASR